MTRTLRDTARMGGTMRQIKGEVVRQSCAGAGAKHHERVRQSRAPHDIELFAAVRKRTASRFSVVVRTVAA